MMRDVISRASIGSDGSSGVERPRLMNSARAGLKRKLSAYRTRGRSHASMSSSTTITVFNPYAPISVEIAAVPTCAA